MAPDGKIEFSALQIVNSTRVAGGQWVNEVYLHNNKTGERERKWQYSFHWPTKSSDQNFWWGPIFETFPAAAQYITAPVLGFADASIIQDGVARQLDDSDSQISEPTSNGLVTLWEQKNVSLLARGAKYESQTGR